MSDLPPRSDERVQTLIAEAAIQEAVRSLALTLRDEYSGKPLTILGVMTGSLFFLADLIHELDLPLQVGLIQASSYRGDRTTPGELRINEEFIPDLTGRHLLLVDDIFDTGQTLAALQKRLSQFAVASLRSAVLLWKEGRQTVDVVPDHHCFRIPDRFVVGYGLDFNNDFRHLRYIGVVESAEAG